MGISFSKVGFEEKIVWCGKSSLKFIKKAIMPYSVKGPVGCRERRLCIVSSLQGI